MKRTASFLLLALASVALGQQHLNLSEALRLARSNSPAIKAAQAEAAAATAGARAAKGQTLPQLSANGFATTGNQTSVISGSPMVEPQALMLTAPGTFLDGNLMLMVPLIATRAWAMASVANWQSRAAAGEYAETLADVDLRVTEAYYQVLLASQMVAVAQARVGAAQELVKNTQAQFEAGTGIQASVSRSQAELASAQRELTSARNDEAKMTLDLKATIGLDLGTDVVVDDQANTTQALTLVDALSAGKGQRGMLIAARARVEAAGADVRAAQSQRNPQLYGLAMGDAANRRDMGGITAGVTLSFPLFDGGRISAETTQARAMKTKAEAQLRDAQLTVEKEVRQAVLDVETARANTASAEASVQAAQSAYDVIALRVSAGKSILVEQLDALQTLTQAKADLAKARFDLNLAIARLTRAAGGTK